MRSLRHFRLVRIITFLTALCLAWLQIGPVLAGNISQSRADREKARMRAQAVRRASGLAPGLTQTPNAALRGKIAAKRSAAAKPTADVRPLSPAEMKRMSGRGPLRNPYFNGTLPWQKSFRDVNLSNGNLFKSFTDIQVAPARGAGLVLQRTYNSNDARVGPFGVGWTDAYDIRIQEAAGVQAESGNPDAVPAQPLAGGAQPGGADAINEVPRTDFFGAKHTYHRDADGLYSPPPYMYDELSSAYGQFLTNGPPQVMSDTDKGMDGTIKHYADVVTKADGSSGNERACDYIEDRYGNRTTLAYGQSYIQADGSTRKLLTSVTDPAGRSLTFAWANFGTTAEPAYRITEIDAPTDPATGTYAYRVAYAYYGASDPDSGGSPYELKSVTLDPDGLNRTTTYTYTSCSGTYYDQSGNPQTATETGLLASVSDPLGHAVSYAYSASPQTYCYGLFGSYNTTPTGTVWVSNVTEPAGIDSGGSPRTFCWTIGGAPCPEGTASAVWAFDRRLGPSGNALAVVHDPEGRAWILDAYMPGAFGNAFSNYEYDYDASNNLTHRTTASMAMTWQDDVTNLARDDYYTYGAHGNQMTHTVTGFPATDSATYYNASQYFAKASQTDMDGHATAMGVGADTAGDPGDPDPNIGDRGQTLWVRDAGYADSSSPSYQKEAAYTYNQYGQKLTETNMSGVVTQYSYGTSGDDLGNLIQVVQDPGDSSHLNRTTTMHYDVMGHVIQSTDPSGLTISFTYNSLGQPTAVTAPARGSAPGETISYAYGGNGRTESVTDGRGTTSISYEAGCDRVSSISDPITGTVSYTYLPTGERTSMTLPGGGTWTYQYHDSEFYLLKESADGLSRILQSITDDQGRIVEIVSDTLGRVYRVRGNETFDARGILQSCSQADSTYDGDYHPNGGYRQTQHQLASLRTTWHALDSSGHPISWLLSENDYSHDNAGQRTSNMAAQAATNPDGSPQFTGGAPQFDGSGNATNQVTASRTETYGYDALSRLSTVDYGDGETQSYAFDAMGNRTQKQDSASGTVNYTYDAANRLLTAGSSAYTSDADGNVLTDGTHANVWDSQNRLVSCTTGGVTSTYTYGADGLRRSSTVNGVTTYYVYDGQSMVREMQSASGSLHPSATYLTGPRGPEYRRDDSATGTPVKWYVYDGLGSVVGEVDPSGSMTASALYDVYGAKRAGGTGTASSRQGFVGALGHVTDDETGLIYMRARYYDPGTGRFISEDPSESGRNWFIYCDNNPICERDFTGRMSATFGELSYDMAGASVGFAALKSVMLIIVGYLAYEAAEAGVMESRDESAAIRRAYKERYGVNLDRETQGKIHREIGKRKVGDGSENENPDLDWDEIVDDIFDMYPPKGSEGSGD